MSDDKPGTDELWGENTRRAIENFPISGEPMPLDLVHALALIKVCAARVNSRLGLIDGDVARAIERSAQDVADGTHNDQFPIDVFQTGSGTSTNMNVNEVVATLASRITGAKVHPNDDVNHSQSSNDTVPTALHVATARAIDARLLPALAHLADVLDSSADAYKDAVKAGRTHLMDAVPITLGQEFSGYARQVRNGIARIESALPRIYELAIGGTAVGTGINAPDGFGGLVAAELSDATALPFVEAPDHVEAQSARDAAVEMSGQLRTLAVSLVKISNDLRWMSSGPRAGLREIELPALQAGSSIMPGKVNPVIPEAVIQVCAQVIGNDAAIAFAGASGSFELNVTIPVIARNLLGSISLLANVTPLLADRCISGISVDSERLRHLAESSPSIATPLNDLLGYDEVAAIVKQAVAEHRTIRDVTIARGHVERGTLTVAQLDELLDVTQMTRQASPSA